MPLTSDGRDSSRDVGFAIVKEFLRRMDGELRVESEPGKGTRYSFRLPAVG
jgi:signal transduction histidine kinase